MGKTGGECHDKDLTRANAMRGAAGPCTARVFWGELSPDPSVTSCPPSAPVLLYHRAPVFVSSSAALPEPQCPCAEYAVFPSTPSPSSPPVPPVSSLAPVPLSCPTSSPSFSSDDRPDPASGPHQKQVRWVEVIERRLPLSSRPPSRSFPGRHVHPAGKVEGYSQTIY